MSLPRYEPMLAVPWPRPFTDPDWLFEPKWDGIRGTFAWDGTNGTLHTRRGHQVIDRYPELAAVAIDRPCVLDGEVVVLDAAGRASFERLQQRSGLTARGVAEHPVAYVVFDVLYLGDSPTVDLPLEARRAMLEGLTLPPPLAPSPVAEDGEALWAVVVERDMEGMVAKRRGSLYRPGVRSPDWRKIVHLHTVKGVVGGFTRGEGGRAHTFGALVLGQWQGDALRWIGNVGTGFSDEAVVAIRSTLDELRREASPFHEDPEMPPATFVEPALVAAVAYRNWTNADRIRQPRFKGFTDDPVDAITVEAEGPTG